MLLYLLAQVDPGTYRQWIEDIGFVEATAALLIIFVVAVVWFLIYQTYGNGKKVNEKLDKLVSSVDKDLQIAVLNAIQETTEKSERRFVDALEKLGDKFSKMIDCSAESTKNIESQIMEQTAVVKTAINIVTKKMLNGDVHE